jgi:hypothetical protein
VAIPLAVVLFVAAIVFTVLMISFSVILLAPILFAEMFVDGVLAATLYRRLRRLDSRHWLQSAIRRTAVPFAAAAILLMIAGWAFSTRPKRGRLGRCGRVGERHLTVGVSAETRAFAMHAKRTRGTRGVLVGRSDVGRLSAYDPLRKLASPNSRRSET